MKHLTSDEIRQRFIEYFKALEEGQEHKDILFEDQLLPIIAQLTILSDQDIDWLLPFSDIAKVRQEFSPYPPYYNRSSEGFFLKIMNALEEDGVVRKKQFLDFICKKMQMTHSGSLQNNQHLKKELDELIANKKSISGEFIFKLYQQKYIHLKEPDRSEEIKRELVKNFSDQEERYIVQRLQLDDLLSVIRFILLKSLANQDIENTIANNHPITDQNYYDYLNHQSESTKNVLFDKLFNKEQYFIDIITKIISKQRLNHISDMYGNEEYVIYIIQLALYRERKDFIAFYIWNNPENIINFLKECDFISPTDKEFEISLIDEKLTPDTGKHILKIYEQKFFIAPLKKIAQEKNIPFDEEGFYQIRRNKEKNAYKHICQLPIYALDIAFLLADGITLSNQEHGHKLRELTLQAEEALFSLIFPLYKLNDFITDILKIIEDYYPQFKRRHESITRQDTPELLNEIEAERTKEQQEKEKKEQENEGNILHLDFLQATEEKRKSIVESYKKTFESPKTAINHISAINHFLEQEGLLERTTGTSGYPNKETINLYRNQVKSFNQWLLLNKGILVKTIRIKGFRGLENIEVGLEKTTVLTGANNTGKSSILYALQLAFGNHQFISQDDFFIKENFPSQQIIIDVLIVPIDDKRCICNNFTEDWHSLFTEVRIKPDLDDSNKNQVPFRTKIEFDSITNSFKKQQFSINGWPKFRDKDNNTNWFDKDDGDKNPFYFDEIPFFYIDAQRDILNDIKLKNSYLGKMISKIEYSEKDIGAIEEQIKLLNDKAVDSSAILSHIKTILEEINSTMDTDKANVEITPFTKKVRDLNKGLSIYYGDQKDSFSMEYHGMGTRSWSSLLTLKTFISSLIKKAQKTSKVFFPILAIEEPEAHLHPNAQKQLYHQINSIGGQKIISTHSPYVAARAKIKQIRGLYKKDRVTCGKVTGLSLEDENKIKTHVVNTHGEIIFSKFIVFSEGQTESQALPVFAEKFFGKHPSDMGLNFVEVRGKGYAPFIQFAKSLKIPWLIFSDAEQDTKKAVFSQLSKAGIDNTNLDEFVVFLDDDKDFEKQLISDGFQDQIKDAYLSLQNFDSEQNKAKKQEEIKNYEQEKLTQIMKKDKIRMGEAIAKEIIKDERFPAKIEDLFNKIKDH